MIYYIQWCQELVKMFFPPSMENQQVRLTVSRQMLDRELNHLGGAQGLVGVCVNCPVHGKVFHEKALSLHRIWNLRNRPEQWNAIPDGAPIFLPYLVVLCLAWTVDDEAADFSANAYYARLNSLLSGGDSIDTPEMIGFGQLWKSLESWTQELQGKRGFFRVEVIGYEHVGKPLAQVLLIPEKLARLPAFFNSTGLRNFYNTIDSKRLRSAILNHPSLSQGILGVLYSEVENDTQIGKSAVQRILEELKKLEGREPLEGLKTATDVRHNRTFVSTGRGSNRIQACLLRVLDNDGSIKVLCRIQSLLTTGKMPLEKGGSYMFHGDRQEMEAVWIAGTRWFKPMGEPLADPFCSMKLESTDLNISAELRAGEFVVMHPSLEASYALGGRYVEVDEIVKGRVYRMLTKSGSDFEIDAVNLKMINVTAPHGLSVWEFCVKDQAEPEDWPPYLPRLIGQQAASPRIHFSGFRLEPNSSRFPVGLPVRMSSNVDNVEPFIIGGRSDVRIEKEGEVHSAWVLLADASGKITLSLRELNDPQTPIDGATHEIEMVSIDAGEFAARSFDKSLVPTTEVSTYPEALIDFLGGQPDTRQYSAPGTHCYFASAPPKIRVSQRNLKGILEVSLDGQPLKTTNDDCYIVPQAKGEGEARLEVNCSGLPLTSRILAFSQEPEIDCGSTDQNKPLEIEYGIRARIKSNGYGSFIWKLIIDDKVEAAELKTINGESWLGVIERASSAFKAGVTYELRFTFDSVFSTSRWIKFRGTDANPAKSSNPPKPKKPHSGFGTLANAFSKITHKDQKKGDKK
jgi:hypothetical protein